MIFDLIDSFHLWITLKIREFLLGRMAKELNALMKDLDLVEYTPPDMGFKICREVPQNLMYMNDLPVYSYIRIEDYGSIIQFSATVCLDKQFQEIKCVFSEYCKDYDNVANCTRIAIRSLIEFKADKYGRSKLYRKAKELGLR